MVKKRKPHERNWISPNSSTKQRHKKQIKARIYKTRQNSKCRLCGNRDETITYIIRENSKLAQKEYKTRHDWVGKVIHWELCKKLKFDHTNKWFMHNLASVMENETHKFQWDFDIQTDHQIPTWKPDLIIIDKKKKKKKKKKRKKKENLQNCGLCCPGWTLNKTEWKCKEGKVPNIARELKKLWNMKVNNINRDWYFWYNHQRIIKGTRELRNNRTSGDHPNYHIIENGQNTEKSLGDLRRLAVTQTPVKDHQLTLMWKTLKE